MTVGAFAGWVTVYNGGDLWTGVLVAALAGAAFGVLHGVPDRAARPVAACHGHRHHASCHVADLLCYRMRVPERHVAAEDRALRALRDARSVADPDIWATLCSTKRRSPIWRSSRSIVVAYVLYRTPIGLAVRTVGENPAAVEAQGIDVTLLRIGAVTVGSAFMAHRRRVPHHVGLQLVLFDMVNGRGWICIALVVFGSWRPGKALLGALLFAAFDAYQLRLQQLAGAYRALPGVPDAALYSVDPGADRDVAARRLSTGADDPLSQGRALNGDHDARSHHSRRQPARRPAGHRYRHPGRQDRQRSSRAEGERRPGDRRQRAAWSRRPSSMRISTWMRPCRSACRASTSRAPCWKASRCGAS